MKRGFLFSFVLLLTVSLACNLPVGARATPTSSLFSKSATPRVTKTPPGGVNPASTKGLIPTDLAIPPDLPIPSELPIPTGKLAIPTLKFTLPANLFDTPQAKATSTPRPPNPAPSNTPAGSAGKSILLDFTSSMDLGDNPDYRTDISQQGAYLLGVKQAGMDMGVITQKQPSKNAFNVIVSTKITTGAAGQIAGVRCMLQDKANYYEVQLKDKSFSIVKVLDGVTTALIDPAWQTSQFINAKGLTGGAQVDVVCNSFGIGLSIEGMGEIPLVVDPDSSFTSGKVAVSVRAGSQSSGGYTSYATFGSIKIQAN